MLDLVPLFRFVHLLFVVIWVGGMFFAYHFLRPVAADVLEPPARLKLWNGVFQRFFVRVWAAVVLVPASGVAMLLKVGMAQAPLHWHVMLALGLVMVGVFIYVFASPYAALKRAVAAEDWPAGGAALARIRQAVGFNLHLGLLTITVATLGRCLA